ncbi:hypothetical protein F4860DRAFT_507839 [Xylaria cubensis]|nr:hypothetical protein F4860DRAFT_507839 [Xylaria cubensis]
MGNWWHPQLKRVADAGGLKDRMASSFRLVSIQPGTATNALSLELSHSTLDAIQPPFFEALSYVWGFPGNCVAAKVLFCQPDREASVVEEIPIRRNLADALIHLRHPSAPRIISERSQQVLLMGDVYRLASSTIAFLGPEADASSDALIFLEKAGGMVEVNFLSGDVRPSVIAKHCRELEWAHMHQPLPLSRQLLIAISHLLGCEWFERLWIRQEIGCAGRKGRIQCGHLSISWHFFCNAIFIMQRKPFTQGLISSGDMKTLQRRLGTADNVVLHARGGYGLLSLRKQVGHAKCADPRDRLYALLSQLPECDRSDITPDYARPVADIYTEATRNQIRRHKRLDIITDCELDERGSALHGAMPSWVPDWSVPKDSANIHDVTPEVFHVGPSCTYIDDFEIHATGVYVGRVASIIHFDGRKMYSEDDAETMRYLRTLLLDMANNPFIKTAKVSQQLIWKACCRVLWLNNFAERWVPPTAHEPSYHKCLAMIMTLVNQDFGAESTLIDGLPYDARFYLRRCRENCLSLALFITEDGHIGAAAESVAAGDEVIALFGCFTPMMLRSVGSRYRIVSACYLDSRMRGESWLGELPEHLYGVLNAAGSTQLTGAMYIDIGTGEKLKDPREEPFLLSLQDRGFLLKASMDELEQRGAWDILKRAGIY